MSYGWLTESSLLPQKKKQMDVESKTFIDLKVNMLKEKEKLIDSKKNFTKDEHSLVKTKFQFKNNNEKERNMIVKNIQVKEIEEEIDYERIQQNLSKKQNIYEKLAKNGVKDLNEHNESDIKLNSLVDFDMKKIQKEKITQLEYTNPNDQNVFDFESGHISIKKSVKQSYDKILSGSEKKALETTIQEENEYKRNLLMLKRKKDQEREDRIERIKKMKI